MNEENFRHYKDQKLVVPVYVNRRTFRRSDLVFSKPVRNQFRRVPVQVIYRDEERKRRVRLILGIQDTPLVTEVSRGLSSSSITSCGRDCRDCTSTCMGNRSYYTITVRYV